MTPESIAEPMSDLETRAGWTRANLIENGVRMAGLGFGILRVCHPTDPGSEWPCSEGARHRNRRTRGPCPSPGKRPIEDRWEQTAEHDPERVRVMLTSPGNRSYGITPPAGTFEWDVDGTAPDRLRELTGTLGPLPRTRVHRSGNGKHVFYRWPETVTGGEGNLFEIVTRWPAKGMVIGPGSVHATSGRLYAVEHDLPIAELPESWARAAAAHHAEERERDDSGFRKPLPGEGWYYVVNSWCGRLRVIERTDGEAWARVQELAPGLTDWETRSDFGDGCRGREQHLRHTFDTCWADAVRDIPPGGSRFVLTDNGRPVSGAGDPVAASTRKLLHFRTARELSAATSPDVPWAAGPWLAFGSITELDGRPKAAGKTTWTLALIAAMLDGRDFLGEPTVKGPVVLATEQPLTSFRASLERARLADRDDLVIVTWTDAVGVPWPDLPHQLGDKARGIGSRVIVVDTLPQFAGLRGDSENDSGAAPEAVEPLQMLAAEAFAVLVNRHDRKGGGTVGESGRGSGAFTGAVDVVLALNRDPHDLRPTMRRLTSLSRFDETPADLLLELVKGEYVSLGSVEDATASMLREAILELLPTAGPVLPAVIAERLERDESTVKTELAGMLNRSPAQVIRH